MARLTLCVGGWALQIKPTAQGGPPRVEKGVPLVGAALTYLAHPVKMLEWAHLMVPQDSRWAATGAMGALMKRTLPRLIAHCV
jgi:hypothetical protein